MPIPALIFSAFVGDYAEVWLWSIATAPQRWVGRRRSSYHDDRTTNQNREGDLLVLWDLARVSALGHVLILLGEPHYGSVRLYSERKPTVWLQSKSVGSDEWICKHSMHLFRCQEGWLLMQLLQLMMMILSCRVIGYVKVEANFQNKTVT